MGTSAGPGGQVGRRDERFPKGTPSRGMIMFRMYMSIGLSVDMIRAGEIPKDIVINASREDLIEQAALAMAALQLDMERAGDAMSAFDDVEFNTMW